jgi:hypothetical protein
MVGLLVLGAGVGRCVGWEVGFSLGRAVGRDVGREVGLEDGFEVGLNMIKYANAQYLYTSITIRMTWIYLFASYVKLLSFILI